MARPALSLVRCPRMDLANQIPERPAEAILAAPRTRIIALEKLGVENRTAAASVARELGLIAAE